MVYPPFINSSSNSLDELGATAIARCSPSNPSADVTQFLVETLKDGIPELTGVMLKTWRGLTHRQLRKEVGHQYLNYQFGWLPFVRDLRAIANSLIHAQEVIDQYARGSGTMIRRDYVFPPLKSEKIITDRTAVSPWINPSAGALYDSLTSGHGSVVRTERSETKRWFKGAFTYYLPPNDSGLRNDIAQHVILAKKLLGLSLTPDNIWAVAPWSWLLDWFSNTSDVLQNWTNWAIDNQVLLYGYMMEHSVHSYTYTFTGPTGFKSAGTYPTDVTLVAETKVRRQATPFGFGVNWDSFTTQQKAIVAALGLSRTR